MSARILRGDVFDMLPAIEKGSVDCVVTSPPYFALRSYLPAGHPLKKKELGSEKSPAEFVSNLVRVFDLVRECMADHAVCCLNIGDTYTHAPGKRKTTDQYGSKQLTNGFQNTTGSASAEGIDAGNLCLIPQRLAIALQDAGWIVRSVIVWQKAAPMPASLSGWQWKRCRVKVGSSRRAAGEKKELSTNGRPGGGRSKNGKDFSSSAEWADCPGCKKCEPNGGLVLRRGSWRPTSSWEPVLMLAKTDRYFADGEAVKTPPAASTVSRDKYTRIIDDPDEQFAVRHDHETECVSGANLRDVWKIAAEPLREQHYASFPTELVYRCLAAGTSSRGYCPVAGCGKPWCRVVESVASTDGRAGGSWDGAKEQLARGGRSRTGDFTDAATSTIDWRPTCNCIGAELLTPRPGLVLDCFAGSGRTGIQAARMGLDFVGCELNEAYCDLAERLLGEQMPLFS